MFGFRKRKRGVVVYRLVPLMNDKGAVWWKLTVNDFDYGEFKSFVEALVKTDELSELYRPTHDSVTVVDNRLRFPVTNQAQGELNLESAK